MSKEVCKIKNNLNSIIKQMSKNTENFVKNPSVDFTRNRKLPFSEVLKILLSMGGNSLSAELLKHFDFSVDAATSSAFVQQRNKISSEALSFLFREFTSTATRNLKTHRGHRVLAADGSALNICINPNDSDTFFQSMPNQKGFNQLHLNVLYDLCNGIYADAVIQPRRKINERRALADMIAESNFPKKTIIVADRNYESYNVFAHIEQKGYKYAIRVKDVCSNGILSSLNLPDTNEFDTKISLKLTRKQTNEVKANPQIYKFMPSISPFDFLDSENKFYPILFRVVRFEIGGGKHEAIITNLDKSEFSTADIKKLYQMRWGVETSFRELKYSIGLVQLHSKKSEFVEQEIFARLIMYNFCSMIVAQVEVKQKSTKYEYQANFTMAIQACKRFFRGKAPPNILESLIQKYILPIRENRANSRNIRPKTFVSFTYRIA